jgi:methionyl-tRNA formyltransferase
MSAQIVNAHPSIVFVGVHTEAYAPLKRLIERGDKITGLVTLDAGSMAKVAGATDLTGLAENAGIPTLRVANINLPESVAWIQGKAPDVLLVVGWTQLLKAELLRVPEIACLGFHASLLPKYRGRAPVNWAIINGEKFTGNTMITLEPEADTGDIVTQRTIEITDEDDCNTVYQKVSQSEVEMLDEILPMVALGALPRRKQDNTQATVMPKRRPEDGIIDWTRSTREIYNWIRALTDPYPGAFSFLNGEKVWIWVARADGRPTVNQGYRPGEIIVDAHGWPWVATADGWIRIVSAQQEGGPKVSGDAAGRTFMRAGGILVQTNEAAN